MRHKPLIATRRKNGKVYGCCRARIVIIPSIFKSCLQLLVVLGQLEVRFQTAVLQQNWNKPILIDIRNLIFSSDHAGNLYGRWGGTALFVFFIGEDISADDCGLDLALTCFAGCGLWDRAGEAFNHAVVTLLDRSCLDWGVLSWRLILVCHCWDY